MRPHAQQEPHRPAARDASLIRIRPYGPEIERISTRDGTPTDTAVGLVADPGIDGWGLVSVMLQEGEPTWYFTHTV